MLRWCSSQPSLTGATANCCMFIQSGLLYGVSFLFLGVLLKPLSSCPLGTVCPDTCSDNFHRSKSVILLPILRTCFYQSYSTILIVMTILFLVIEVLSRDFTQKIFHFEAQFFTIKIRHIHQREMSRIFLNVKALRNGYGKILFFFIFPCTNNYVCSL